MPRIPLAAALIMAAIAPVPSLAQQTAEQAPSNVFRPSSALTRQRSGITLEQAKERTARQFQKADANGDGVVSRDEMRAFREHARAERQRRQAERERKHALD